MPHSQNIARQSVFVLIAVLSMLVALSGCIVPRSEGRGPSYGDLTEGLYDNFGTYHRPTSTRVAAAQAWFDQGLQLLYGFNHDEAIRSFQRAGELDRNFAMASWGEAYALGLHINNPVMGVEQSERAYIASRKALAQLEYASPVEAGLIRALSHRYAMPVPEDRSELDAAYADEMRKLWSNFDDDSDVGALFAESLMNLQPWDLWITDGPDNGQPKGNTEEIIETLETVLAMTQDHPGANHFYIHTVEASPTPERGIPAADRLQTLVPGSGHLVHMPAHIYARVGRWADSSDANVKAIDADRAYFAKAPAPDFYSLYFIHNIHFLAWSAMMEGRYETAMNAARELERDIPQSFLREWTFVADGFMPVTYHTMIRFGKWEDVLREPAPEDYRRVSLSLWHYARGIAFANTNRAAEAEAELSHFESVAASIPEEWLVGVNPAADVMEIARHMLRAELAYHTGRPDDAFALLQQGVELEDALAYDEPPDWMQPVRHAYGALLMAEDRHDEAHAVYLADLERYPENGWALIGLREAVAARGEDASSIEERLANTWRRADVAPVASCYCHPDAR